MGGISWGRTGVIAAAIIATAAGSPMSSSGAEADYVLGRAYKLGQGVRADNREAERLLGRAAALGHVKAGDEYGLVLMQNDKPAEALPWLRKAAERGDARAQYGLGTLLFSGRGVKPDKAEARRWIARAARSGLPVAAEALRIIDGSEPVAFAGTVAKEATSPPPPVKAAAKLLRPQKGWRAQLGAFANPANARRHWDAVRQAGGPTASFGVTGGLTYLRAGPFPSREDASSYCAAQQRRGRECLVVN